MSYEKSKDGELFDSDVEAELSDLDGDGGSDAENYDNQPSREPIAAPLNDTTEEQQESPVAPRPKLPSFKKQNRSDQDDADIERIREEIRAKKQRREEGGEDEDEEGGQEEDEEPKNPPHVQAALDEFDRQIAMLTASGRRKKKKVDEVDLERSMDEEVSQLRDRMKMAVDEDIMANNDRKPALAKIKMLNEVVSLMTHKRAQDAILDNQLLDMVRLWLEPLPDRSLPSLDIQNELLDALDKLPIVGDHLRESGVGKIVYFYQKSPRVDARVKRRAEQLVAKWSRLVIKRTANYRERLHERQKYSREEMLSRRKKFKPETTEESNSGSGAPRMHVNIPRAVAPDYDVIPESTVTAAPRSKHSKDASSRKRLANTMRSLKGTGQRR
ncbi:hypothetical protein LRAMOSA05206 [Lichtheimia ramosa]|uniref:TFIIS N-terminal domain-containing protein n=1 Tax=Lichtheimia ramosa TaxID=688394 RepID=A0A077X1X7_9FUNG|nr:hypothetical protein LRAMOSA05206 [Lichtheimia ramosa]